MIKLLLLLTMLVTSNPKDIARINSYKKEAEKSFIAGEYEAAISRYKYLMDSMNVEEDEIILNLAHSYYQLNDTANARSYYSQASMSPNNELKSVAYQQLGVMSKSPQTLQQAKHYLKASLKANPNNIDARYDYEVVQKLIKEQEQQQQENQDQENKDDQNKEEEQQNEDQEQQDQQDQGDQSEEEQQQEQQEQEQQQQDQEGEEQEGEEEQQQEEQQEQSEEQSEEQKDQEMSTKEKLEEMNISEEKAQMILEAMRNAEVQYLQQQKRKATERPKSGKPDW
ncbi:MAG: hypothetical protein JXQ90_04825 [Cyclobacteriaceae bacterium]